MMRYDGDGLSVEISNKKKKKKNRLARSVDGL